MSASHEHAVKFYASEQSLYTTVGSFLGQALTDGQPVILIANAVHRSEMLQTLRSRMIDVDAAIESGELVVLDTHDTMLQFMIDGMPDPLAFQNSVGALIARMLKIRGGQTTMRAYGEMV